MNCKEFVEWILNKIESGVGIIKVGTAHKCNELTVEDVVTMNEQHGLTFDFDADEDTITIRKEALA